MKPSRMFPDAPEGYRCALASVVSTPKSKKQKREEVHYANCAKAREDFEVLFHKNGEPKV